MKKYNKLVRDLIPEVIKKYSQEDENFKLDENLLPDENKTYYKISKDLEEIKVVVTNKLTGLCFFPTSYTDTTYNTLFPTIKATTDDAFIWLLNSFFKSHGLQSGSLETLPETTFDISTKSTI